MRRLPPNRTRAPGSNPLPVTVTTVPEYPAEDETLFTCKKPPVQMMSTWSYGRFGALVPPSACTLDPLIQAQRGRQRDLGGRTGCRFGR